jgi:DNA-binding MarR family transcriptional regulator
MDAMADQPENSLETRLEDLLTFRLVRFNAALNRQSMRLLRKSGELNIPAWRIISFLAARGQMTGRQLAENAGLDTGLTSRCLQDLAQRGLVRFERRAEDRRALWAELTDAGRQLEAQVRPVMRQRHDRLLAALDETERKQVFVILDKLTEAVTKG